MAIKVYGISTYNAQRVTLALLEFGIEDFELVKVDLAAREHFKPEFLAIQPFAQIPILECGDFHLYESRAIARYIAEKFKDQGPENFLGKTLEEQAVVYQWIESEAHQFNDLAFAPWSMEYYLAYREKRPVNEEVLAPLRARLEKFFNCVEARLSKSKYLAGNHYSMADMNIAPSLLRVMILEPELITSRKHVKAWYDTLTFRPTFKKMLEADAGWAFPYGPFAKDTTNGTC
jgi:glutathione S-transferase